VKTLLILAIILSAVPAFACQVIETDRIFGRDFAAANSEFATLDPKLSLAAAPIPGVARIFRAVEIARLAQAHNIELTTPIADFCFERATEPLTIEKLTPALRTALHIDDAQIEILDFSRSAVPLGTLSFACAGLSTSGVWPNIWRGRVTYDETRSIPIWVKVKITVERTWIEASETIATGKVIEASQLVIRKGPRFPFGPAPLDAIDLAIAHKALRSIRAGDPIFAAMLTTPPDVERGDTVRVEVTSGGALLEFNALAQAPAHIGEFVLVKNPENSRYFKARVDEKGKVSVEALQNRDQRKRAYFLQNRDQRERP
jgi:flagella basal body P-ring formation protein FlgA